MARFLGADGHHYDVESEFFLHHEEVYHSTAETQTDEAYNHPEDLEHFAQHEAIEAEELRREQEYQGIPQDEPGSQPVGDVKTSDVSNDTTDDGNPDLSDDKVASPPPQDIQDHPHDDQKVFTAAKPKFTRVKPPEDKEPTQVYASAFKEGHDKAEWGQGEQGYKRPKTPADRLRKNLPYKYKFRKNWGDF